MLNIKRAETYELAKAVAEQTGQSITDAVTDALREKLARLSEIRSDDLEARRASIRAIQARFRALPGDSFRSADIDAILYDDQGLPK